MYFSKHYQLLTCIICILKSFQSLGTITAFGISKQLSTTLRMQKYTRGNTSDFPEKVQTFTACALSQSRDEGEGNEEKRQQESVNQSEMGMGYRMTKSQLERLARIKRGPSAYNFEIPSTNIRADSKTLRQNKGENKGENKGDEIEFGGDGGVKCTGEPSIDPSRTLQNVAGVDSEWLEDVYWNQREDQDGK